MKKLMTLCLSLLLLFGVASTLEANVPFDTIDVTITPLFDDDNGDPIHLSTLDYGGVMRLDTELTSLTGYTFAFWVVNGSLRLDYAMDHAFTLVNDMDIQAVFSPDDKHAVLFMDTNGKLLDYAYVHDGEDAAFTGDLPSKPGMQVADPMWDQSLNIIQQDTVFLIQYTLTEDAENAEFNVSVINGIGDGVYPYNEFVTVVADEAPIGQHFTHWEVDDRVVSYESEYTFTPFSDTTIRAVYDDEPLLPMPLITISDALTIRSNHHTFKGQFYVPDHFELIEYGMLVSASGDNLLLGNEDVTVKRSQKHTPQSQEWLMSFEDTLFAEAARAYLIVKNTQGELMAFYSGDEAMGDAMTETFASFSGSGTSYVTETFTGDTGVEWTVTETRKNLDTYAIDDGGMIVRVPGTVYGIIPGGFNYMSLDLRMAFTSGSPEQRTIEVDADGALIGSHTLTTTNQVETLVIDTVAFTGDVALELRAVGTSGRQITINNLAWSQSATSTGHFVQLTSDEDVNLTVDQAGPFYQHGTSLIVDAEPMHGHAVTWVDALTGQPVHVGESYRFTITQNRHLRALYTPLDDDYTLTLTSNLPEADVSVRPETGLIHGTEITLHAPAVAGHRFEYFKDLASGIIFTNQATFSFYLQDDHDFLAFYLEEGYYDLYLSTNLAGAVIERDVEGPYTIDDTVELHAHSVEGYRFVHWYDLFNDSVLASDDTYVHTITQSRHVVAVYEGVASETVYETGFEDATKGAYAAADVEISDKLWRLDDALIGSLANDQKHGLQSVRIRNGHARTLFAVDALDAVSFYYGKYGNDANSTLSMKASVDGETWTTISTYDATGSFQQATLNASDVYGALNVDVSTPIYLMWDASQNDERINIDDVVITHNVTTALSIDALTFIDAMTTLGHDATDVVIHYIDIGTAGDAMLIQIGDIDLLVDAGLNQATSIDNLLDFLAEHITDGTIEYIIPSHAHADHIGGYPDVFDAYDIGTIFNYCTVGTSAIALEFDDLVNAHMAEGGTVYRVCELFDEDDIFIYELFDNVFLEFYNTGDLASSDLNESSVVFTLDAMGTRALFNGDAGDDQEAVYGPLAGHIDVLKMGHHGSRTSTSSALVETIDPSTVIVNVNNLLGTPYGHPHYDAVANVYAYSDQIPVYVIAGGPDSMGFYHQRNGTITVSIDEHGYSVSSEYYGDNPIELSKTDYWKDDTNAYRHLGYAYAEDTGIVAD